MKIEFKVIIENDITKEDFTRAFAALGLKEKEDFEALGANAIQSDMEAIRDGNCETLIVNNYKITFDEERKNDE